jgi:hypothetical protein
MKTEYVLEPLILSMQDAFMQYSEYFENDLPLGIVNTLHITSDGTIMRCNLDNLLHNQEQKLKLYNYLFYKLILSKKYNHEYSRRIASVKNGLNMIIWFDCLFNGMSLCSYEEYALNKKITPKLKRAKMETMMTPPKDKTVNFKLFGYSTKNNFNLRIYALNEAVQFYGIDNVLRVLKKIQHFNLCLKEDYKYTVMRYHLFPKKRLKLENKFETIDNKFETIDNKFETNDNKFETNGKKFETYGKKLEEVVEEGLCPDTNKQDYRVVIGSLEDESYDTIAHRNVSYFKQYDIVCIEQELVKSKIKKMYSYLNEVITY